MFVSLFGIAAFAIAGSFSLEIIFRYLIIFGFTVGLEYVLWKIRKINPFLPSASFVTATIIFLLSEISTPFYFPLIAVIFAVVQKQFVRPWGSHLFNPAAFGLFVGAYFGNVVSWWGPNLNAATILITLLAAGYVSAIKMRQWKIILPFLVATVFISFLRSGDIILSLTAIFVGASLFFSFVMLPEPVTAAKGFWQKPVYGVLVAILPSIFYNAPYISDLQLASLLGANLTFKLIEKQ